MSSAQPFIDEDERIYQATRREFLGLPAEAPDVAAPVAESPTPPWTSARHWKRFAILLAVFAVLGILGLALLPLIDGDRAAFAGLFLGFSVTLAVVAGATALGIWIGRRLSARRAAAAAAAAAAPTPPRPRSPWMTFAVTFAVFVGLCLLTFSALDTAWLIGTLIFHEAGHFLGMRMFGYKDVQMFFIPLFGAAVKGEKKDVPAWQEAIVLLLGPLPGLILGCAFYFVDHEYDMPVLRAGATWLVTVNFLNLMPLGPLDGGRLWNRLLFSRFAMLESMVIVPATVGLVFICLDPGWICLALSAVFGLMIAPGLYRTARAAAVLQERWPSLPAEEADLNDEQLRVLYAQTKRQFASKSAQPTPTYCKALAGQMKGVYRRALLRPAPPAVTACFAILYAAAIAGTLLTASFTHLGADAGRWPVHFKKTVNQTIGTETEEGK